MAPVPKCMKRPIFENREAGAPLSLPRAAATQSCGARNLRLSHKPLTDKVLRRSFSSGFSHNFGPISHTKTGMYIVFFRSIFIFVILLIVIRLMGKRQIGEMQPFELTITLIIADLATIPMSDTSIPLLYGVVSIFTLFILHQVISLIERKSRFLSGIISGTPTIVINSKGVNFREIERQNLSIDDLLESIRGAGYSSFDEIAFAIFETNGKLSVIPKKSGDKKPDQADKAELPIVVIEQGKISEQQLKVMKLTPDWIRARLREQSIRDLKKVELCTLDNHGKMFLQIKDKGYEVLKTDYEGGVIW